MIPLSDNKKRSLLNLSACYGHLETVVALLEHDARLILATDDQKRTAAHHAAAWAHTSVLCALLERAPEIIDREDGTGQVSNNNASVVLTR